jgi:sorbitol-specific phosphotransferase system component IIA
VSYQVTILGHSSKPHNDEVKKVAVEAVKQLRKLGHQNVSLSGYSHDETGGIQLVDADVPESKE